MKEILKELRTKNRYSQELLAKILGLSRQAYMKYESGEVEPSVEIVRKLAKIYKVPYEVLIDNQFESGSKTDKKIFYKYNHDGYIAVASPAPAFSESPASFDINTDSRFAHFSEILFQMQEMILSLQTEINFLKEKPETKKSVYSKSKKFNKTDFFEQIGTVKMDPFYIVKLREESLI